MKHTVLITGARRGIGKDAAMRLAKNGHDVIATTHTKIQAKGLQEEMDGAGLSVRCEKLDLLDKDDHARAEYWHPTVIINNAAVGASGPIDRVPESIVKETFETNVFATLSLTQKVFPYIKNKNGRIVFISSVGGRITLPYLGPYAMTKHAIESVADSFRRENKNVHVSVIEPGPIATGFNEKMNAEKYEWLQERNLTKEEKARIKAEEAKLINEQFPTDSVARAIVHAVESNHPRTRYVRPFRFGAFVFLDKILPARWIDRLIEMIY